MKRCWPGPILFFVVILAIAVYGLWQRQPSLIELQRQFLVTHTEAAREKSIRGLENYYATLPVPKPVRQHLEQKTAGLMMAQTFERQCQSQAPSKDGLYELEQRLTCLSRLGLIAIARGQPQASLRYLDQAELLAQKTHQLTGSTYWQAFIRKMKVFGRSQAESWLQAHVAEELCRQLADNPDSWRQAEYFAAAGLQLSRQTHDLRLELDLLQTLQFILNEYYGFSELSVALAESHRNQATAIRYDLRAMGIAYHEAFAFQRSGQFDAALRLYGDVRKMAEEHRELVAGQWYTTKALLKSAEVLRELGQYQESLSVCNQVAQTHLSTEDEILLYIARGLVRRSLADYEMAEADYQAALHLAQSTGNAADAERILTDLGTLHFSLTEYDRALESYKQAKELQDRIVSSQSTSEIDLLINMAEVNTKLERPQLADEYLQKASLLAELGPLPWKKAELLNTLGESFLRVKRDSVALTYFQKALSICEANGLVRVGLRSKLNLAETLIRLSRFDEANRLSLETVKSSRQIDDPERVIDSLALLTRIAAAKGDYRLAVEASDKMIDEIQKVSSRLQNQQRLISFQQKIYGYLKEAVRSEISNGHPDMAFLKLEFAKTLWSSRDRNANLTSNARIYSPADLEGLRQEVRSAKGLIIQYMVTPDTLYAFILDTTGFHLLEKHIDMGALKTLVNAYKGSIDQTAKILDNYESKRLEDHYADTTRLGEELYDNILGWPSLQAALAFSKTVYVVPDEFLYEVPISTLVTQLDGRTCFLAEKTCVLNVASAFLASSSPDWKKAPEKRVLVSADPSLPGSQGLVALVKQQFPAAEELMVPKDDFIKSDVLEKMRHPYQVYILFGHGRANSQYPELSSVEITARSSVNSSTRTFQFSMADLQKADWSAAELVWLVGCETAEGKLYQGSGISGLQQSLLTLGARSVLASLWKIDAAQAVPQVQWFLNTWSQTLDPAAAFNALQRHSIQALRQDNYYRRPHPYLWGSYTFAVN